MPTYDQIANAYLSLFKPKVDTEVLSEEYLGEEVLLESRIDWLKQNIKNVSFAHDPQGPAKTTPELIDKIAAEGDPTHNKVHTQFLLNLYHKGNLKQEDLYKAHDTLKDYEGTTSAEGEKKRGVKHSMTPEERQINHNNYPTIQSLQQKIASYSGGLPHSKIAAAVEGWNKNNGGIGHEQVYDDPSIRIYKIARSPEGKEASKAIYGPSCKEGHTDWCTANHNEKHNFFDSYMGDYPGSHLHVVHRKSDGKVFQYHTHSDSFMDPADERISPEDFKSIQPSLHKAWEKNPDLLD